MNEKHHVNLPSLAPRNFEDALKFSEMLAQSNFVPASFKGKAGDILAAIQMGYEVGLSPMAALQNIAVINGRPSMWGDALLAIVQASGLLESIDEQDDGTKATCTVKRKGDPVPRVATFSMQNAQKAGLANKQGPWTQYPDRMRQMRARGFALRDKFADVLKGLITREEAIDITPPKNDAGELSPEETPRARVEVKHDAPHDFHEEIEGLRQDAAAEEGAALESGTTSGDSPVPGGDHPYGPFKGGEYPTADEVMDVYRMHPSAKAAMDIIRSVIPDLTQRGGLANTTGPELKKVMEALRR